MSDYYTYSEGRVCDQHDHRVAGTRLHDIEPGGVDFKTPLVSFGQGEYRRDITPPARFPQPKWRDRQPWWRTLRNPFRTRTA